MTIFKKLAKDFELEGLLSLSRGQHILVETFLKRASVFVFNHVVASINPVKSHNY